MIFTIVSTVALSMPLAEQTLPSYMCHRVTARPTIDGKVDGDPAWETLPAATGFYRLGGDYTLAKQTVFRMGWDDDALYLAVVCEEPDAAHLKPVGSSGDNLWQEDSVEFFIMRPGQTEIYQFFVGPGGAHTAATGAEGMTGWTAAATVGKTTWSAELRLPWKTLGARPQPGQKCPGTVCRNTLQTKSGGDRFTCWAPLRSGFHEPEHYGHWVFQANVLPAAGVGKVQATTRAAYRASLVNRLESILVQDRRYRPMLRQSRSDTEFGPAARKLSAAWDEIRDVGKQAASAPMVRLRRTLQRTETLLEKTYTHCYTFLMEELFRTP